MNLNNIKVSLLVSATRKIWIRHKYQSFLISYSSPSGIKCRDPNEESLFIKNLENYGFTLITKFPLFLYAILFTPLYLYPHTSDDCITIREFENCGFDINIDRFRLSLHSKPSHPVHSFAFKRNRESNYLFHRPWKCVFYKNFGRSQLFLKFIPFQSPPPHTHTQK